MDKLCSWFVSLICLTEGHSEQELRPLPEPQEHLCDMLPFVSYICLRASFVYCHDPHIWWCSHLRKVAANFHSQLDAPPRAILKFFHRMITLLIPFVSFQLENCCRMAFSSQTSGLAILPIDRITIVSL